MTDFLLSLDITVFRWINHSMSNVVFDYLMPLITNLTTYKAVLALIAAILLWMLIRGNKRLKITAILLIVTITCSDQLSSSVIKFWFERPRPCHTLEDVRLLVGCGSGYSFPSSHAVNNFAAALIITFFFPRKMWWWFGYAATVAFSRVYVGVHYPLDVVGGAIVGLACACLILIVFTLCERLWMHRSLKNKSRT